MKDRTKIRRAFANMVIYERPISRKMYTEVFDDKISYRECLRANIIYDSYLEGDDVSRSLRDRERFKFTEQEMKHITELVEYMIERKEYITRDKCDELYPELLGDIIIGTAHKVFKACRHKDNFREGLAKLPQ